MFRRWILPILAILLAGSAAAWWIAARGRGAGEGAPVPVRPPSDPPPPPPPPERPPPIAVLCGGELGGRLRVPPCSQSNQGGLDRIGGNLMDMIGRAPNSLVLDLGDATCAPGEAGRLELVAALAGLGETGLGVSAVGEKDLAIGLDAWRAAKADIPGNPKIICANVRDEEGRELVPGVAHGVSGSRKFVFAAALSPSFEKGLREGGVPIRILPAAAAVRAALAAAGKADYVVLLSHAPLEESRALLRAVPEADLVLTAHAGPLPWREPEIIDGRMLLAPGSGWLYVGGALLRDTGPGRKPELFECLQRSVSGRVPGAPTTLLRVDHAMRTMRAPGVFEQVLRTAAASEPPGNPTWIGPAACVACHATVHASWKEDVHARTMEGIRGREFSGTFQCLTCHATAPGRRGGRVAEGDAQDAVTCEACHGPGAAHAAAEGRVKMGDARASCAACHVPDMSPGFKFEDAWPRLKHGK
jgi:hypothetical protein